jgi:hypothetical protein
MVRMLFRPFRFELWLVMGFAAFLSELFSGGGGGSNFGGKYRGHVPVVAGQIRQRVWDFFHQPGMMVALVVAGSVALVLTIVLLWVNSRGRFIFLDNVIYERPAIADPWKRYAELGNSLFGWTLVFGAACIGVTVVISLPFVAALRSLWYEGSFHWAGIASIFGLLFMAIPVALVAGFTLLFLYHFVVPIMMRHNLSTTAAWGRFMPLLRAHPGSFFLFGVMMLLVEIVFLLAVVFVGALTCCVGFLLFAVPYVKQVVLLPALATIRGIGPEFLAQFGPEFDLYSSAPAPAPPAPAPAGGGA